jgi:hypothetical protein
MYFEDESYIQGIALHGFQSVYRVGNELIHRPKGRISRNQNLVLPRCDISGLRAALPLSCAKVPRRRRFVLARLFDELEGDEAFLRLHIDLRPLNRQRMGS